MGFGSYDESEQEKPDKSDVDYGEDMTREIKGESSEWSGKDSTTDESKEDMMKHLKS